MSNIVLSIVSVGILLIIIGIMQNLVSSMIPELEKVLDYPSWVISCLLSMPAITSFVMILVMSFVMARTNLRQCIRVSSIVIVASMGVAALGLISNHLYVSIVLAAVGRFLFGFGWVPLQMSLNMLLRNRFARSNLFVRNSLWNVLINFTFVGMVLAYFFTPAIIELSIHFMALVLGGLIVVTIGVSMLLPTLFAEYLNTTPNITTLNPPERSLMQIVVISMHNFMTTGLWMGFLLYLPSVIVDWNAKIEIINYSMISSFIAVGVAASFGLSLFITTKRRWLWNIMLSTLAVVVACILALLDYDEPILGIAILIVAASTFYMTPFIASNALFVGSTLSIAYQWIYASTFLGMSVFPLMFMLISLLDGSSTITIVVCMIIFGTSGILAYIISMFIDTVKDDEFTNANLNFMEVVVNEEPKKIKDEEDNEVGIEIN